MEDTTTKLIDQMFKLSRLMKEGLSYDWGTEHLSVLQIHTLVYIKKQKTVSMGDIATHFRIELPSATSLITKLVKEDLAKRKEDKKDRRLVKISLTPKGSKLLASATKAQNKIMAKHMSYLPASEKKQLLKILEHLTQRLESENEK